MLTSCARGVVHTNFRRRLEADATSPSRVDVMEHTPLLARKMSPESGE